MDQSSKNHHQHPLGINKFGKSIRKSPLNHASFQRIPPPATDVLPPPQPQVYNINKSDFRSIVQQLTGSPARESAAGLNIQAQARPPQPKPSSSRLMKIRPPPLTPISRPPTIPLEHPAMIPNPNPCYNSIAGLHLRPAPMQAAPSGAAWADSPVSAYMRYLESSLFSSDSSRRTTAQGLLPGAAASFPSPRGNLPPPVSSVPAFGHPGMLPFPGSQFPMLSPSSQFSLSLQSSQFPLPSPNSQLPLSSPSSFLNLLSPKSPYPLLSPGYFQSFSPNFSFSTTPHSGILGPGPGSLPSPSPGLLFPPSPSGFLPLLSPRWREM